MKSIAYAMTALVGLSLLAQEVEARRLGGAKNVGLQRSVPAQQPAAPKAPAQQPQQQAAQPAPAQQGAATPKWLAPLTGFALGAGLAALFLHHGWAGVAAALLVLALVLAGLVALARALRARAHRAPLRYATAGAGFEPGSWSGPGASAATESAARWPAGFDAAQFVRHARRNFVRLQEAHDRGELSTLRDFLSPALLRELEAEVRAAGISRQKTEVLELRAEVLDVATEPDRYLVSVRFEGLVREAPGAEAEPFREIWHLEKPLAGGSGWLLAGIQQA